MIHTGNSGTVELWNSKQLNMIHTYRSRATVGEVLSVQCFNPEWCKSFEGQWIAVQHRGIKYFFEISTGALLRAHLVSCVRLLAIYPPQHKQAGLQIQRNTNRNTASNSSEIRIQQIQSSMGSTESLCFPDILMSSFEGSWDTLFMRESRTIPLLTMPALS